jgi:VanZ family protein
VIAVLSSCKSSLASVANKGRFRLALLYVPSAICVVLLFVGGPDYYSPPSYKGAWSLGHILAFFLWSVVLMRISAWFATKPISQQILIGLFITLSLGFAIEWLQTFVGRTFSVGDVLRDLTGSFLAIAFLSPARRTLAWAGLRGIQAVALLLVLLQVYPVVVALANEIVARRQFPVLSDLETPFERSRWKSGFPLRIDKQVVRQGRASLRVQLMPNKYAGLTLNHFPEDWRGYSTLRFSVFNASHAAIRITCRIHDKEHIHNGEAYSDRFNERFMLAPGWNDLSIPLDRIKNAPAGRTMDLARVQGLALYIKDLDRPIVLYIDAMRLE